MRRFLVALLFASLLLAPAAVSPQAHAQGGDLSLPMPAEAFFRYEGRVYRATLSITTYVPGILFEGQASASSTSSSFSIQSLDGRSIPPALQSASLVLNTRRRGLRLQFRPSEVSIQVVGYAAYYSNFASPIPAGQRVGGRVELQTPRGRIDLNFNTIVVGLATPLA